MTTPEQLADELYAECREDIAEDNGIALSGDQDSVLRTACSVGVQWAETQPAARFTFDAAYTPKAKRQAERRAKREARRDCRAYINDPGNWPQGFLFGIIEAIIFQMFIVFIARWLVDRFFDDPGLPLAICKG